MEHTQDNPTLKSIVKLKLREAETKLLHRMDILRVSSVDHKTLLSPIRWMASELLMEIFVQCLPDMPKFTCSFLFQQRANAESKELTLDIMLRVSALAECSPLNLDIVVGMHSCIIVCYVTQPPR